MAGKFKIGDQVLVVPDEGLDTPREARGKTGRVTGYLHDEAGKVVEYWVELPNGLRFNATDYHIIAVGKVNNAQDLLAQVMKYDPDLGEALLEIQGAVADLQGFSLTTVLLVLAWVGVDELRRNPRYLVGSGIHEAIK